MLTIGLKSKIITRKDNLLDAVIMSLKKQPLQNGDVLIITSKVVAVTQGRVVKINSEKAFHKLVRQEADQIIGSNLVTLTLKNSIFIAWSGIDRSNSPKGTAILWPKDPFEVAEKICKDLKKEFKLNRLGIIISDSCCLPLRKGVSAVTLGYAGFEGVTDMRGKKDLYGNKLKVTQQGTADMLAVAAHLIMGESDESTPFVIVRGAPVKFTSRKIKKNELNIAENDCIFNPLYKNLEEL